MTLKNTIKYNTIKLMFLLCFLALVSMTFNNISIVTIGILANLAIVFIMKPNKDELSIYLNIVIINMIIIIFLYLLYQNRYGTPYYLGGSDDLLYEIDANSVVSNLKIGEYFKIRGNIVPEWHNSVGYIYILSLVIRFSELLGGYSTITPRMLNGFILGIISILSYRIVIKNLELNKSYGKLSSYIVGLSPIMMYTSSHIFRDIIVCLIIISNIYLWINIYNYNGLNKIKAYVYTVFTFIIMFSLRGKLAFIIPINIIIILIFNIYSNNNINKKNKYMLLTVIIIIMTIILPIIILKSGLLSDMLDKSESYKQYLLSETGGGLSRYIFNAPMPMGIFLRILYLSISPIPVISGNIEQILLGIGTIFQIVNIPFILIGVYNALKQSRIASISIIFICIFEIVSLTTFTFRHIVMYYPLLVILGIYGYKNTSYKFRVRSYLTIYLILIVGILLYLILKY